MIQLLDLSTGKWLAFLAGSRLEKSTVVLELLNESIYQCQFVGRTASGYDVLVRSLRCGGAGDLSEEYSLARGLDAEYIMNRGS